MAQGQSSELPDFRPRHEVVVVVQQAASLPFLGASRSVALGRPFTNFTTGLDPPVRTKTSASPASYVLRLRHANTTSMGESSTYVTVKDWARGQSSRSPGSCEVQPVFEYFRTLCSDLAGHLDLPR